LLSLGAVAAIAAVALLAVACGGGTSSSDKTATASARQPASTASSGAANATPTEGEGEEAEYATQTAQAASETPSAATTPAAGGAEGGTTVKVATAGSLGQVLTDAQGLTLYTFTKDTPNSGKSAASGAVLQAWPPLYVDGTPTKADSVSGDLGTITTAGKQQVTYKGMPLYHYAGDGAPGETNGQGIGGVWFVATP
jgi:predicted lipoprotein with Yx(FWY)xxD motif